jgi:putative membrane protein
VATETTRSANELAEDRTHLAASRNLMAADRTLMAWIRTALSMITFGFTIYKLLENFAEKGIGHMTRLESPRFMGLFLTGLGTLSMVMGTVEYWFRMEDLRRIAEIPVWRMSFVMALIMSLTGLAMFVSIVGRLL